MKPQVADPWTRPFCFYTLHTRRNLKRTNLMYNNSLYKFHVVIIYGEYQFWPVLNLKWPILMSMYCASFSASPLLSFMHYTMYTRIHVIFRSDTFPYPQLMVSIDDELCQSGNWCVMCLHAQKLVNKS